MTTTYHFSMFPRLEPRTPFQGGRITDTDVLNLTESARFASVHAGAEITSADFLRAAGRGEITLRAIVHQTAKLQKIGGGIYCNAGQPNENIVPNRSILNLPLSACQQLAATGRASWRKFDGFEQIDGQLMRYVIAELTPDEPDFETTPEDCRLTGNAVHALADDYLQALAQTAATPAPLVAASASGGVDPAKSGPAKPLQRTAAQDAAILREIEKQGYNPQALPKNPLGKPGAKAAVRTALSKNPLFTGGTVFDKAWERLTARADIAIQG